MISTSVKIVKLFRSEIPTNSNWFKALLFVEVSKHTEGGNQLGCTTGLYHKSFWIKEFHLTDEEFEKLIVL